MKIGDMGSHGLIEYLIEGKVLVKITFTNVRKNTIATINFLIKLT